MCTNCLSQAEVVAGHVGLAAAVLKAPVHRFLADVGLVAPPNRLARDAHTVAFLRKLDLDPVEVLGADVVTDADAWVAAGRPAPEPMPAPALGLRPNLATVTTR
jgi:hypothetical protein